MAQWLMNLTWNPEVVSSIPGLDQWIKDWAQLQAVVQVQDTARTPGCCGCGIGQQVYL